MAHHISERMLTEIEGLMKSSPLDKCEHIKKRREPWWCNPSYGVRQCLACFTHDAVACYDCDKPLGSHPTYFCIQVCRMGGSKVADTFVAPVCRYCAVDVPLGDWGTGYLETLVDNRRTFIMFNRATKDAIPSE